MPIQVAGAAQTGGDVGGFSAPAAAMNHQNSAKSSSAAAAAGGSDAMVVRRSGNSSTNLKRIFLKAMSFKSKKSRPKNPADIVSGATALLAYVDSGSHFAGHKHGEKMAELDMLMRDMKVILYGNGESEPLAEACSQLTQQFFKEDTLRLLVVCLPQLHLEARKDATQVVANLQRQPVHSRLIACDYLESNLDLMDLLIIGYEDPAMALHFGGMLRECIRHQVVTSYVLKSVHMKKFFDYIQLPSFDVAADASATFKELMTRHKSTVAEFLTENYEWFFAEFNSKLLESLNYITRRQATKLLGDILLDRSNAGVMVRYVSSKENLRILMNLLRESSKSIQLDAFHVFKLFVANQYKPSDIINILVANRNKLIRLLAGFKSDKEDESFEADRAEVVKEISELIPTTPIGHSAELPRLN